MNKRQFLLTPASMDFRPIWIDAARSISTAPIQGVGRRMITTFVTQDEDGVHTYTGHVVSRGPTSIVVMLTEPFALAGRSVIFPIAAVLEERVISV